MVVNPLLIFLDLPLETFAGRICSEAGHGNRDSPRNGSGRHTNKKLQKQVGASTAEVDLSMHSEGVESE